MIFDKLLYAITTVIEFIAKAIIFLLNALGLWIPAIYSIAFVAICAIFKVSFTQVLAIYFVGLILSFIFAFYVMIVRVMNKKKRRYMEKQEKRAKGKIRKNEAAENKKEGEETNKEVVFMPPKTEEKQNPMEKLETEKYQPYQSPVTENKEYVDRSMQSYPPLQTNPEPPQYIPPKENEMTYSKPKVFRTRMDPNLLIYEYSDRLVFYKKTLNGLEHIKTERKM